MTSNPVRVEADGTRVYADYHRYKPKQGAWVKGQRRKPDDPAAVRWRAQWLLPLVLLEDEQRVMPPTRPDEETLEHRAWCRCEVCRRPAAQVLWRARQRLMVSPSSSSSSSTGPPSSREKI